MTSPFDEVINRYNTNSMKWDGARERFGEDNLLPMWVADMDFRVPTPVVEALKKVAEHGIFGYTVRPDSFYQSLIDWFWRRHRWTIEKEWIHITPGVVPALSMIVQAFTNPGDKIVIQSPVYHPFFHVVNKNERELVDNTLYFDGKQYRINFADLEEKLSDPAVKMLILCSPHNPVGRVWAQGELTRLGELCLKHDVLILSDEIHCDLIFKRYKHVPLSSICEAFAQNTITCVAPSKTFNLAGLQASAVIIPNERHRRTFTESLSIQDNGMTNTFSLAAFEAAYNHGESWLDELIDYLEGNLQFLNDFMKEKLPQVNVIQPEGTYLVWMDFRFLGLSEQKLEKLMLKKAKVALNEGYIFGKAGAGFERMNIACPRKTLEEGLTRIEKAVNQFLKNKTPVS